MWKKIGSAGALAHGGTAVYSLIASAAHAEPLSWLFAGVYAVGPGLFGLVTRMAINVFNPPVRPVLVLESDADDQF